MKEDSDKNSDKYHVPRLTYYSASTIVAMVMAIPGIVTLLLIRNFTRDITIQIVVSSIVFFLGMGFSFKIAKKIADKIDKNKKTESD